MSAFRSAARLLRNPVPHARLWTWLGVIAFLAWQYGSGIWRLANRSGGMDNKFSALAREHFYGFLIGQNLQVLIAYVILALLGWLLLLPVVSTLSTATRTGKRRFLFAFAFGCAAMVHGWFMLRLAQSRPYFLADAEYGQWYHRMLTSPPPALQFILKTLLLQVLPIVLLAWALLWYALRLSRHAWWWVAGSTAVLTVTAVSLSWHREAPAAVPRQKRMNVIVLASDSLRADRLGCAGYRPQRGDGPAAAGVSPVIDELASRSVRFEQCYTPIASTLESSTTFMSSMYPHTHGIRQMYPDRETVRKCEETIEPIAQVMARAGYDTAAIGDWCAGFYDMMPLGFNDVSVSSFDNFQIYMSQAVVMAHFVVPLYFDNAVGYKLFPQLQSFAQFVTPDVVTNRVVNRIDRQARSGKPFFWHVFYSCNHLPYRARQPFSGMFADPKYEGPNKNGVDFDIDSFISGTDLESKWKALPDKEVSQIRALYDGCTRQFDTCVGRVLEAIKRNGMEDNTIVVITADHGDDMYEPLVTLGHGLTFNGGNQANHIPMIVHVPGMRPQVFAETIRTIDVMPTLAELADVKVSPKWEGRSVAGWMNGTEKPEAKPFYGETGFPFIQFRVAGVERPKLPPMDGLTRIDENFNYQFVLKDEWRAPLVAAKQRCLRTMHWKLVCTPTAQGGRHFALFHLPSDPNGEHDLAAQRPEVLHAMKAAIERWIDERVETPVKGIFPQGEPS